MLDPVRLSHLLVQSRLPSGGIAVDATAGNGHDTLFLARHLGSQGHVHAFDIQEEALATARRRLDAVPQRLATVQWHWCGHETVRSVLAQQKILHIDAAMFNLGYLPGGDKALTTCAGTTVAALSALAELLAPHGLISIVAYAGHDGGLEEREVVLDWARGLGSTAFAAWRYTSLNRGTNRAELVVIERLDPGRETR